MTDIASLVVKARADGVALVDGQLKSLNATAGATAKGMTGLNHSLTATAAKLGSMVGIAAVGAALTTATRAAIEFEKAMAEISTLTNTMDMAGLTQSVRDLSKEFGADRQVQAKALYQIISAGAATAAEATNLLAAANRLAIGGVTDVRTAADGLTSALNAYGKPASEAVAVSDAMFTAMKAGKTTIEELSSSIGHVAPLAAQAGVGLEELLAATAAVTVTGVDTSMTMNAMRQAIANIIKPSKEASDVAKALGIDFSAAGLKAAGGFVPFMQDVEEKTKGSTVALSKMFGSVEALGPVMTLVSESGGKRFLANMDAMEKKAGATAEAFDKMSKTASFLGAQISAKFKDALLSAGMAITEHLTPALKYLSDNFDSVMGKAKLVGQLLLTGALMAGIMALPSALATLGMALVGVTVKLYALAVAVMANPLGLIATGVAAAVAAFVVFQDELVTLNGTTATVTQWLVATWKWVWQNIGVAVTAIGETIKSVFTSTDETVKTSTEKSASSFRGWTETFKLAANLIIGTFDMLGQTIGVVLAAIIDGAANWARSIVNVVQAAWDGIKNVFTGKLDFSQLEAALTKAMLDPINNVSAGMQDAWKSVAGRDYIGEVVGNFQTAGKEIATLAARENLLAGTLEEVTVSAVRRGEAVKDLPKHTDAEVAAVDSLVNALGDEGTASDKATTSTEKLKNQLLQTEAAALRLARQMKTTSNAMITTEIAELRAALAGGKMDEAAKATAVAMLEQQEAALNAATAADSYVESQDKAAASTAKTAEKMRLAAQEADPFAKALEGAVTRIDSAFVDLWRNIGSGWNSFKDSLLNSFSQMLAEMAHMAITRPIMVSIVGSIVPGYAAAGTPGAPGTAAGAGGTVSGLSGAWSTAKGLYSGAFNSLSKGYANASYGFNSLGMNTLSEGARVQSAAYGAGGWTAAGMAAANVGGTLAGSYAGRAVFNNKGSTGLGAGAGGVVGGIFGAAYGGAPGAAVGSAIGSFIGEGLEKALATVFGFSGQKKNRASGTVDTSLESGWATGGGKHDSGNLNVAKDLAGTIKAMGEAMGAEFSASMRVSDRDGIEIKGKTFKSSEDAFKYVFNEMMKSSTGLSESMKAVIKEFDGTTTESLNMAAGLQEIFGAAKEINSSVLQLITDFNGTADETLMLAATLNQLEESGADLTGTMNKMIRGFKGSAEELTEFVGVIAVFQKMIEKGSNAAVDALVDWFATNADDTMTQVYKKQKRLAADAINAFDGTTESALKLVDAFGTMQNMAYELSLAIMDSSAAVAGLTKDTAQQLRDSIKTDEQLFAGWEAQRAALKKSLPSLRDPGQINDTVSKINDLTALMFNSFTDDRKIAEAENYAKYIENIGATAQTALSTALKTVAADMASANTAAAAKLDLAALKMSEASTNFSASVNSFGGSVNQLKQALAAFLNAQGINSSEISY